MTKKYITGITLLLVIIGVLVSLKMLVPQPQNVAPSSSVVTVHEQVETALKEGKPFWLMLRTTNCPYCVELKEIFNELKPEYEGRVVFIDVNLDLWENSDFVKEYQVSYVPVTYIFDKEGNISFNEGGLLKKELLIQELDKVSKE